MIFALAKTVKSFIKTHLPRGANLGPAVVQLFLNDGRKTHISLINFPAFLAPHEAGHYSYELCMYGPDGRAIGEKQIDLPLFGSIDVDLIKTFGSQLPSYGMVTARIKPQNYLYLKDRHLGRIRPHFFAFYTDSTMNSLGLVHPQINLDTVVEPNRRWVSNLQLDPQSVMELELFQINPSLQSLESEAFLEDTAGNVLATRKELIPPYGTRRVLFNLKERNEIFSVGLQGLAAANGKPLLFMHFKDGSFSCCHG